MVFIRNEIATRKRDDCHAWQTELRGWIGHVLENGMPMEQAGQYKTFGEQNRQAVNAETGLLVMLDSSARVTGKPSAIGWPNRHSAANWLARIVPHEEFYSIGWEEILMLFLRRKSVVKASLRSLPLTGLSATMFFTTDIQGVDLSGVDLSGAALSGVSNLRGANLRGTDLRDADLSDVRNLADAILRPSQRADLKKKGLL